MGNVLKLDFSQLYAQLDIEPGCSLDEFRRAYRRRIGTLHPDRSTLPEEADLASELNMLYEHAIDFHKRFGRLPGAAPSPAPAVADGPALPLQRVAPMESVRAAPVPALPEPQPPSRYRRTLWLLIVLAIIGSILWDSFAWRLGL
ncbi:J domain-containing protein [Pseudoxanthomonas composti]|uniref:J domain-containing protein n=1 Tax=Pseudoxanthomonas composti TaxID=2137479 RepID=A0A4Q1JY47_9GAMM|nr:J domain-containing protein [Pseudoxanthomonas composti]RXR08280.1 hypothetical protein EPA99_00120 [Pseudoxanthomonas composti]